MIVDQCLAHGRKFRGASTTPVGLAVRQTEMLKQVTNYKIFIYCFEIDTSISW